MNYQVYMLTCIPNGKRYVGITSRPVKLRMREHRHRDRSFINKAIRKYGWHSFAVEILESVETLIAALDREAYWIDQFQTAKKGSGYNINPTPRQPEWKDKSRRKSSKSRKKAWKAGKYKDVNWSEALTGRDMGNWSRKRRVLVHGVGEFDSILSAAKAIGSSHSNLSNHLHRKKSFNTVKGYTAQFV